jgi:hypothetical protein
MNGARYFMRREEYQPPRTPPDSPFRQFVVRCLHCESFKLKLSVHYDEDEGAEILIMQCKQCRRSEKVVV